MISLVTAALRTVLHGMIEDWTATGLMFWNFALITAPLVRARPSLVAIAAFLFAAYVNQNILGERAMPFRSTCPNRAPADRPSPELQVAHLQDQIHALEERVHKYLFYDGTGLRDLASAVSGGRVIPELTSETCAIEQPGLKAPWYKRWSGQREETGAAVALVGLPPEFAIYPDTQVGSCWPMKGRSGSLGLALIQPAIVTSFTVDHAPRPMTFRYQSALRSGELWGLIEEPFREGPRSSVSGTEELTLMDASTVLLPDTPRVQGSRYAHSQLVRLASFTFDVDSGPPFQTFNVSEDTLEQLGRIRFSTVVFVVRENWGNDAFTCIYRVRVHSDERMMR